MQRWCSSCVSVSSRLTTSIEEHELDFFKSSLLMVIGKGDQIMLGISCFLLNHWWKNIESWGLLPTHFIHSFLCMEKWPYAIQNDRSLFKKNLLGFCNCLASTVWSTYDTYSTYRYQARARRSCLTGELGTIECTVITVPVLNQVLYRYKDMMFTVTVL